MRKIAIYIMVFFSFAFRQMPYLAAQESGDVQENLFTEENVEKARGDVNYADDYFKKKREKENRDVDFQGMEILAQVLKFLFIALIIGVVVFILVKMLSAGSIFKPKSKKIKGTVENLDFDDLENNLQESDLEAYLKDALSKKEHKIAVRLYFLMVIRDLSDKDLIRWKKDKTNRDYLRETSGLSFHAKQREVTQVFERVWYGEFNINASDFNGIQPKFQSLLQDIKTKGT